MPGLGAGPGRVESWVDETVQPGAFGRGGGGGKLQTRQRGQQQQVQRQGLTLVHFSAQLERFVQDRGSA
jgi:hypothetical protein